MTRIYTDNNGVYTNAFSQTADGRNVEGHQYQIVAGTKITQIDFQTGGVKDNGVNGITSEALLAILIHRTKYLNGAFPCDENSRAINHLEDALANFEMRTSRRIARGVEGKNIV